MKRERGRRRWMDREYTALVLFGRGKINSIKGGEDGGRGGLVRGVMTRVN